MMVLKIILIKRKHYCLTSIVQTSSGHCCADGEIYVREILLSLLLLLLSSLSHARRSTMSAIIQRNLHSTHKHTHTPDAM